MTLDAGALLQAQRRIGKRLYVASSSATGAPALAQRFAQVLERRDNPNLEWKYRYFPDETHATIYHPAALRAFREMFKPTAPGPDSFPPAPRR